MFGFNIEPKVSFLIAGAQKCGTTALDGYLRDHPEICMADVKEVHFFDDDDVFLSGSPDYETLYHKNFKNIDRCKLAGEATPIYMYWEKSPERIQQYNPSMKIIMLLRNPIERAYSHWNMEFNRGQEDRAFMVAIEEEIDQRCKRLRSQHRVFSYIDRGFYSNQLRRMWRYFPKDQTLIIKSEWLRHSPNEVLSGICQFLGVSSFIFPKIKVLHEAKYDYGMDDREKRFLKRIYKSEIGHLEDLLGWDCAEWLSI